MAEHGITNRKRLTPNQKRLKEADFKLQNRLRRLRKEGYVFPENIGVFPHSKRITKKDIELYEKSIMPKELKEKALYKVSIEGGHKFKERPEMYSKRKSTSLDFRTPEDTPKDETVQEDFFVYKSVIRTLESAVGNTPFAQYVLQVITDELPHVAITKGMINEAISRLNAMGLVMERKLLYEREDVENYLTQLVLALPVDDYTKGDMLEIIEGNQIFEDPDYTERKSSSKI